MTLKEIEKLAESFAEARSNVKEGLESLESEITAIKKQYLPSIRRAIEKAAGRQQILRLAIEENPELFIKPKTFIFHGIRLGYMKARGEIVWEDEPQVIKLIKKHFPDDHETYIKATEKVIKTALAQLPAAELKKLGVTIIETTDEVVIKPTDSEIDKLINALLKEDEFKKEAA